jgi:hypothetical protein
MYINDNEINWHKIVLVGHSQGSGHVAYLAQTQYCHRAVMISGPQEGSSLRNGISLSNDTHMTVNRLHWLHKSFLTTNIYCFKHSQEEGTSDLILQCWLNMFADQFSSTCTIADGSNSAAENEIIHNHFIKQILCVDTGDVEIPSSTRMISSNILPDKYCPFLSDPSKRPFHNSTVNDTATPFVYNVDDNKLYSAYSLSVWPYLVCGSVNNYK